MTADELRPEADVVIVGGGGSGLAAACEAASHGRRVILLEKNPQLGGSTAWSVGSLTASRTPDQRRVGITDSPLEHFEDMGTLAGALAERDNLELRRVLTENITETVAWLRSQGVEFIGPFPEPPHRKPRMHIVVPTAGAYIYNLGRRARALGVSVRTGQRARRLIRENGRVVGVECESAEGGVRQFRARRAVVLAGGDYSGSAALKSRLASASVAAIPPVNATATGDCQVMVEEIGGRILNGDLVLGPVLRFVPPLRRRLLQAIPPLPVLTRFMRWSFHHLPAFVIRPIVMSFMTTVLGPSPEMFERGALLLNRNGEPFLVPGANFGHAIAQQPEGMAHMVLDQRLAELFEAWPHFVCTAPGVAYAYFSDFRRNRPDLYCRARSAEELAAKLGMPADRVCRAIAQHIVPTDSATRRLEPPLYGLGPIRSYVVLTDGGVKVSRDLEVLTGDGEVIEGLYAAGSTGQGGLLLEGHGHHIGWAFTSGRIAGRNAAMCPSR